MIKKMLVSNISILGDQVRQACCQNCDTELLAKLWNKTKNLVTGRKRESERVEEPLLLRKTELSPMVH